MCGRSDSVSTVGLTINFKILTIVISVNYLIDIWRNMMNMNRTETEIMKRVIDL